MSRRNRKADGARAESPQNILPWWQVILSVSRECGPHRTKFERVVKHVMALDGQEALGMASRMLMPSQTVINEPHVHRRDAMYMDLATT